MLAVAACSSQSQLRRASLSDSVPDRQAIVLPPPGGPSVVAVTERRYSNAIQQEIALASDTGVPGQNFFRVQVYGPVGSEGGRSSLGYGPILQSAIGREMRQSLPGVAMRRSSLYVQNSYGPFGYAVGRRGRNDLCMYAWQRISQAGFFKRGTVQVRLRLCKSGAPEHSLLAVMYGYTINASFDDAKWNPYGDPPPPDPRLGQTGQPVYPVGLRGMETVLQPAPALAAEHRPRATTRKAPGALRAVQSLPAPPPDAPIVPPPPAVDREVPTVPPPPATEREESKTGD
jgi:hypothetical protein